MVIEHAVVQICFTLACRESPDWPRGHPVLFNPSLFAQAVIVTQTRRIEWHHAGNGCASC